MHECGVSNDRRDLVNNLGFMFDSDPDLDKKCLNSISVINSGGSGPSLSSLSVVRPVIWRETRRPFNQIFFNFHSVF